MPCAPEEMEPACDGSIQKREKPLMPFTPSTGRTLTCSTERAGVAHEMGCIRTGELALELEGQKHTNTRCAKPFHS